MSVETLPEEENYFSFSSKKHGEGAIKPEANMASQLSIVSQGSESDGAPHSAIDDEMSE